LAKNNDRIALDELIPQIVEDHRHLMQGKDLAVSMSALAHCEVMAPIGIVQAAIGNLLRNAIENSDQGTIRICLDADATVTIEDPGHGMTPEEIARIYAQIARGAGRDGGGIGLDLLARLCEHLGWFLRIDSTPGRGTIAVLAIGRRAG
jgi:signal transduction histidine kinase